MRTRPDKQDLGRAVSQQVLGGEVSKLILGREEAQASSRQVVRKHKELLQGTNER